MVIFVCKKLNLTVTALCSICIMAAMCHPVKADIYMYLDEDGIVHFTNTPVSADKRIYIKEPANPSRSLKMPDRYDSLIQKASDHYNISFFLLKALIKVESDFNPYAESKSGAKGLMQIMPENIDTLRIKNVFDPTENIMGGSRYLKQLLEIFKKNVFLALAAYNAGPNAVTNYGSIPPFDETEQFVNKVMTYYHLLKLNNH